MQGSYSGRMRTLPGNVTDIEAAPERSERSPSHRLVRRIAVLAIGIPVSLIGIVLLVVPGPGTPVLVAGLAILAIEFQWAQRHMDRLKALARKALGTGRTSADPE